jgi:bifunctional DNA-binding transcriptional regulator/antitoxin component of YhaV-PrlF toxin-antitoxin module
MSEVTLTSKGQITIPVKDRITFKPMPDGPVVMRAKTKSLVYLKGILNPLPDLTATISEMSLGAA